MSRANSVQSLSRVQICNTMACSTPGLPVHHHLPEHAQTHVHRVGDAIQPPHPLPSPSPPALNLSQYQGLFQWVSSSHQVAKVLEFQLQHQSFLWILRTDLFIGKCNLQQYTDYRIKFTHFNSNNSTTSGMVVSSHWPIKKIISEANVQALLN